MEGRVHFDINRSLWVAKISDPERKEVEVIGHFTKESDAWTEVKLYLADHSALGVADGQGDLASSPAPDDTLPAA